MASPDPHVTQLILRSQGGEGAALDELLPLVYEELRALAGGFLRREAPGSTLQPTALVNEVYLRMVDQKAAGLEGRAHFLGLCARVMRRVLVDRARARHADKRGARERLATVFEPAAEEAGDPLDVLAFDEALERLAELDPRKAQVVELRSFSGLTMEEIAQTLGTSKRTVEADWTFARAWLKGELA